MLTALKTFKGKKNEEISENVQTVNSFIKKGLIMSLPEKSLMIKVKSLYEFAKSGMNQEEGYVVANDGYVSTKKRSEGSSIDLKSLYDEIKLMGKEPAFDIHTHPLQITQDKLIDLKNIGAAYPSGEIGTTKKGDFNTTREQQEEGLISEPCWVLGFCPKYNREDDIIFEYRINFYISNWVFVSLQQEIAIKPIDKNPTGTSSSVGGSTFYTTANQGIPFENFESTVNKIRKNG